VTALATLLCCVPTTFAAAVATTSVGLFVADYQGWCRADCTKPLSTASDFVLRSG
jgi:hypothetical protein